MSADPEIIKNQSICQYRFTLLGSALVKATCKVLMKLTSGNDFTNILQAAFLNKSALPNFYVFTIWLCIFLAKEIGTKTRL